MRDGCPPHKYRPSGQRKVTRSYFNERGKPAKRTEKVNVYGALTQLWFCTKCEHQAESRAGGQP